MPLIIINTSRPGDPKVLDAVRTGRSVGFRDDTELQTVVHEPFVVHDNAVPRLRVPFRATTPFDASAVKEEK